MFGKFTSWWLPNSGNQAIVPRTTVRWRRRSRVGWQCNKDGKPEIVIELCLRMHIILYMDTDIHKQATDKQAPVNMSGLDVHFWTFHWYHWYHRLRKSQLYYCHWNWLWNLHIITLNADIKGQCNKSQFPIMKIPGPSRVAPDLWTMWQIGISVDLFP